MPQGESGNRPVRNGASSSFSAAALAATAPQSSRNTAIGVLCGLTVVLIWAGWAVATRFAVTTTLRPPDVAFIRFAVATLLLLPVLLRNRSGGGGGGLELRRIGLAKVAIMVCGAGAPFIMLCTTAMIFAPASHTGTLMVGAMPIFVALMSALFFGERFDRPQLVGFAAVIVGVLGVGGNALLHDRAGIGVWRGDLLLLLSGAFFAAYTLALRRSGVTPWQGAAIVNTISFIGFAPIYLLFLPSNLLVAPWHDTAIQILAQGVGAAVLALFFYGEAVRRLGAPRAAILGSLTPGVAALLAVPALGETLDATTVIGIVLVTAGVMLVSGILSKRRTADVAAAAAPMRSGIGS